MFGEEIQYMNYDSDMWKKYCGQQALIRFNPENLRCVRVFDIEGRYICDAAQVTPLSWNAAKEEVAKRQRETRPVEPEFVMTSAAQAVTNVITYCHLQGKCGIAYGDPGVGKTMACAEYARKNSGAIVFELPTNASSIERVNDYLMDALKIKVDKQRYAFDEIVARLTGTFAAA